jgi:hypothetical protein
MIQRRTIPCRSLQILILLYHWKTTNNQREFKRFGPLFSNYRWDVWMRNPGVPWIFPMLSGVSLPKRRVIRILFYLCIVMYIWLCYVSRNHLFPHAPRLTNKAIRELDTEQVKFTCIWSVVDGREKCKPRCGHGYFGLYGMKKCHPWLSCEEIDKLKLIRDIGSHGYVKEVL